MRGKNIDPIYKIDSVFALWTDVVYNTINYCLNVNDNAEEVVYTIILQLKTLSNWEVSDKKFKELIDKALSVCKKDETD